MTRTPSPLPLPAPPWRAAAVVFGAAFALRAALVAFLPDALTMSEDYTDRYARIARALVDDGAFRLGGSPTAASAPLYPLALAAVYALVGDGVLTVRLALALADAALCALVYVLARRVGGARVGATAAAAAVACPYFVYMVYRGFSEPLFLALHTGFLVALVAALDARSAGRAAGAGVLLGLATLTRAVPLFLPLALAVPFALRYRGRWRAGAAHWGALVGAFLLVLAPWTVRNEVVFGRVVPVQTLGGYHAADGAAPPAAAGANEADVDAGLYGRAAQAARDDLGGHAALTAERLGAMWFRTNTGRGERALLAANALLLALAAAGAVALRERRALVPLAVVVAYYVAVHSQMVVVFRYMLTVLPVLLTLAAAAAVRGAARVARGEAVP